METKILEKNKIFIYKNIKFNYNIIERIKNINKKIFKNMYVVFYYNNKRIFEFQLYSKKHINNKYLKNKLDDFYKKEKIKYSIKKIRNKYKLKRTNKFKYNFYSFRDNYINNYICDKYDLDYNKIDTNKYLLTKNKNKYYLCFEVLRIKEIGKVNNNYKTNLKGLIVLGQLKGFKSDKKLINDIKTNINKLNDEYYKTLNTFKIKDVLYD